MTEDSIIISQAEDKIAQCVERDMVTTTQFLDPHQQSLLRGRFRIQRGGTVMNGAASGRAVSDGAAIGGAGSGADLPCRIVFYGGFEDAERVVMVCLPSYIVETVAQQWEEPTDEKPTYEEPTDRQGNNPITRLLSDLEILSMVRVSLPKVGGTRPLSHRDYLGSLMGLGIKREMIGDILVRNKGTGRDSELLGAGPEAVRGAAQPGAGPEAVRGAAQPGADIILLPEMADYVCENFDQAGRVSLLCRKKCISELIVPQKQTTIIKESVSSMRLDNLVSAAFGISRTKAAEAIGQGLVFVDHMEVKKVDARVAAGSIITLRHKGRARLLESAGETKKGRTIVRIEKY